MAKYGGNKKAHNERKNKSFERRYGMSQTEYHNLKKDNRVKAHSVRMKAQHGK